MAITFNSLATERLLGLSDGTQLDLIVDKFTIAMWFKTNNNVANMAICSQWRISPQRRRWMTMINTTNEEVYIYYSSLGTDSPVHVINSPVIPLNQWQHLVRIYDGTQSADADESIAFLNGVLPLSETIGSIPDSLYSGGTYLTDYALSIGGRSDTSSPFGGSIAEFTMWKIPLTNQESASLYRNPHTLIRPDKIIHHYSLFTKDSLRDRFNNNHLSPSTSNNNTTEHPNLISEQFLGA